LIAGCKEQAGEAVKGLSPQPDPPGVQVLRNDLTAARSDIDYLKTQLSYSNNMYDQLKAENNALKTDLAKFSQATNVKLELLKVKAGIANNDASWAQNPILTGFSWNNPASVSPIAASR
jgi:hypothetical protein